MNPMPAARLLALTLLLLAACRTPPDMPAVFQQDGLRFEQLAPEVWLHTSYRDLTGIGSFPSNGLIVTGRDSATLVDTAWTDEQTAVVLDWAQTNLGVPVTRAVFTHAHADKMGGVGTVRRRGIETYAHRFSNDVAFSRDLVPAQFDLALDEDSRSVDLGDIVVYYPGPGHTIDNIVVWHRKSRILFGGCLTRPADAKTLGNTADAVLSEWANSAKRVADRFPDVRRIVPSHGDPAGPELLQHTADLVSTASETQKQ